MAFQRGTYDLACIDSYAEAQKFLEKTKPIRGSSIVPVSSRRVQDVTIFPVGECVVIRYHHTDIIQFKPDGEIIISTNRYNTPSTRNVIDAVLGAHTCSAVGESWIRCKAGFYNDEFGWLSLGDNSRFRKDGYSFRALEPVYPMIYTVDRQKANAVRKRYRDFTKFAETFMKLHGATSDIPVEFNITAMRGEDAPYMAYRPASNEIVHLLDAARDPERYVEAVAGILCVEWGITTHVVRSIKEFRKNFTEAVMWAHGREFIEQVELRSGRLLSSQNHKYKQFYMQ
jgi:hypothetical protein